VPCCALCGPRCYGAQTWCAAVPCCWGELWVVGRCHPSRCSCGPAYRHAACSPPAVCVRTETAVPPAHNPTRAPPPPRAPAATAAGAALLSHHRGAQACPRPPTTRACPRQSARACWRTGPPGARRWWPRPSRSAWAWTRRARTPGPDAPPRCFFPGGFKNSAASIGARRSLSSTRAVPYSQPHIAAAQDGQRRLTHERAATESRARRAACPAP